MTKPYQIEGFACRKCDKFFLTKSEAAKCCMCDQCSVALASSSPLTINRHGELICEGCRLKESIVLHDAQALFSKRQAASARKNYASYVRMLKLASANRGQK